jgi:E3 ubiquitin-protein ligase BRE1
MSCRNSPKKLDEELMKVNNQIAELNSEARETAVQQLEEEIRVCKNMFKCTVCSDRPKEVKTGQLI